MSFFSEHLAQVLTLVCLVAGLAGTWSNMKTRLANLSAKILENRIAAEKQFTELRVTMDRTATEFRQEHSLCRDAQLKHQGDSTVHATLEERQFRAEWRRGVIDRLERIEALIIELKNHNGGVHA